MKSTLLKLINWVIKNKIISLVIIFLISLGIKLIFVSFSIFTVDSFAYLLKSLEIAGGNFIPMSTHAIGWPLFVAPFFYFFKSDSIFTNMAYGQLINSFIGALTIFPSYLLSRQFFNKNWSLLTAFLTVFSFWFMYSSAEFFAEPLFTLLLLLTLYFTIKSQNSPRLILFASIFAGFSYWIKPNGCFLLAIIIISYLLYHYYQKRKLVVGHWSLVIATIIIFIAITSPFLYQRYIYFGSPFNYGENSKYFVDTYNQLWGQNSSNVSFIEYLKSHTFADYFDRFILRGLGGLLFSYLALTLPFSIFFIWGLIRSFFNKKTFPLLIAFAVFTIGLIPIYAIYFTPRHLFPLIPIAMIFSVIGIRDITSHFDRKITRLFIITILTISLLFLAVGFIYPQYYFLPQRSSRDLDFGRWVAHNIQGKIAIGLGGDFIMANLPDATVAGVGLFNMKAPQSKISLIYPGYFDDADLLNRWLKKNKVNYIALNRDYTSRMNHQLKIYTGGKEIPNNWKLIYSDYDPKSSWAVDLYKILDL